MSWNKDFSKCPPGNQPFIARRLSKGKYKYAIVTRTPQFYAMNQITLCVMAGVGKGFQAQEWCHIPHSDDDGLADFDFMRKTLMDIAAIKEEPKSKAKAQDAIHKIKC